MNLSHDQFTDWCEHVEYLWENLFLTAAQQNGLAFDTDVEGWDLYDEGKRPYLSLQAGPSRFDFKGDPYLVAVSFRRFADDLQNLIAEQDAAGGFQPRVVESAEAIQLMNANRKLRRGNEHA